MPVTKVQDNKLKAEKKVNGVKGKKEVYDTSKTKKEVSKKLPEPVIVVQEPKYSKSASKKTGENVGY